MFWKECGIELGVCLAPLFDEKLLDLQTLFFELTMMANGHVTIKAPFSSNRCTKMWSIDLNTNQLEIQH